MNASTRVRAHRRGAPPRADSARTHRIQFRAPSLAGAAVLAAAGVIIGGLTLGTTLAGQAAPSPSPSEVLTAVTGTVQLVEHEGLAPGLAEVRLGDATAATPASGANRLLALAPDGGTAAVAAQVGPLPTTLTLAHRDGSRLSVSMPGLIGAGFSPDGSWLATIDGVGSIWRVATSGMTAARLADGPFIGSPIVEADGAILALRVSSVEAPIVSRLVRISPDGSEAVLVADDLVYGMQVMSDGTIAYAAHQGSRTFLKALDGTRSRLLADLGEDAVNVTLEPAADAVAYERSGQVILRRLPDGTELRLGAGTHPQFAPDGLSVLVELPSGSALIGVDGRRVAAFDGQAGFAGCAEGCQS